MRNLRIEVVLQLYQRVLTPGREVENAYKAQAGHQLKSMLTSVSRNIPRAAMRTRPQDERWLLAVFTGGPSRSFVATQKSKRSPSWISRFGNAAVKPRG